MVQIYEDKKGNSDIQITAAERQNINKAVIEFHKTVIRE